MTFPFPREPDIEAYFGGWTRITEQIRQGELITVTRGGDSEQPQTIPSAMEMLMDDQDGHWNPDNPASDYAQYHGRNTPIRYLMPYSLQEFDTVIANGWPAGWTLDGTAANFDVASGVGTILVPDSASTQAAYLGGYDDWSTYEVSVDVLLPFPTSGGALGCTSGLLLRGATLSTGYRVALSASEVGEMFIGIFDAEAGAYISGHPILVEDLSTPTWFTVKAVVEGHLIQAKAWRQAVDEPYDWVATYLAEDMAAEGGPGVRAATSAGATNTLISFDNFRVRIPRYYGEITSLKPSTTIDHKAQQTELKSAGILRRLGQGRKPIRTTPEEYFRNQAFPATHAYVPFDDGELTIKPRSFGGKVGSAGVDTDVALGVNRLGPLGKGDLAPWLNPCANLVSTYRAFFTLVEEIPGTQWAVHFALKISAIYEDASSFDQFGIGIAQTSNAWAINFLSTEQLEITNGVSGVLTTQSVPEVFDGNMHHIGLKTTQVGADITWEIYVDGAVRLSGTDTAATLNAVNLAQFHNTPFGDADSDKERVFGHCALWTGQSPDADEIYAALFGYPDEASGRRAERLCGEYNIPFSAKGNLDNTALMGPQSVVDLVSALDECAFADQASLMEFRGSGGLLFQCHNSLYTPVDAPVSLDYSDEQVAPALDIFPDDKETVNDWTLERVHGGSLQRTKNSGPLNIENPGDDPDAVGRYDSSENINLASEDQLPDTVEWLLHVGTQPESRCPIIKVDLQADRLDAGLVEDLLQIDLNSLIQVQNLTPRRVYHDIRQIVRGYTEVLDTAFLHTIEFNGSPASIYDGVEVGRTEFRIDSGQSELSTDITDAALSMNVSSVDGLTRWVTASSNFPFNVQISFGERPGEIVTVSAISTATPQVFTLSQRGVNGVQRAWPAGAKVRLPRRHYVRLR